MSKMMTPKDKVGRVVFLSEIISDARNASSCCVGAEANLERLATQSRQPGTQGNEMLLIQLGFLIAQSQPERHDRGDQYQGCG